MTARHALTRATLAAAIALLGSAAGAQTVLKIGYATTKESHYGVGSAVFCDEIAKGTANRYSCQQFPSSALGGEREMIEAVQLGTQDLVNTSTGPLGNFVPEVKVFDIPFLFRGYDHARHTMDGAIGQDVLKALQKKGLIGLAWTENGFRHMTNNKRPIVSAADAAGLKLRTMENKVHMEGYKTFGLLPTPMAFPELFGALQQGTVDGQENPIPVILASKFSQVQKHLSLTGHVYSPAVIILSPVVWGKLNEADKKVFSEAAVKAGAAQRKKVNDDEASGIAQLRKDGMQVVEKVDGDSFRKAVTPAYANFAKEFGADKIAAIQAVK
ncbi:TRAP transporter substrate-binding protein [Aquabacterium sp. OR-4]|uniref:TRAP transporter substrate-binding protein n=1 Tax=Aquabacterium sp. OR-4 TaxID=2978127 RepID=UPI0021B43FA3|nr:TRAP transporter substrate-binding protein [Aquabacterium sp. OR-4]MDT7834428.1 TRAP transporter substrate-binding protein [Aquabacterium sp. OR-4]